MQILHIGPVKNDNINSDGFEGTELSGGFGPDGPSRSILGLANGLAKKGEKVGLLSTKQFNYKSKSLPPNIKYLKPYTGGKYNFRIDTEQWISDIQENFGTPDIVNFHDVYDIFSVRLAKKMKNIGWKYFITPRGGLRKVAQQRDRPKKIVANFLFFNSYLENASFIQALTQQEADDIKLFNKRISKVIIVPNALHKNIYDSNKYSALQKKSRKKIVVGFIGQLFSYIKGIDLLLDAIKLYQENEGDNMRFIFIGPKKTEKDQKLISKKLKKLKFNKSLEFKGAMYGEKKWIELSKFDVFVLPSRTEGMPLVALEAMAFGKPCLFTKGTNMVEFILEAKGGWGAEIEAESIYKKLVEIANTPQTQLEKMGQYSRKYFLNNFTWEIVTEIYLSKIHKILNQ